jgi:hypothetical protein
MEDLEKDRCGCEAWMSRRRLVGWMGDAGSALACADQHMAEYEEDATPSARGGVVRVIDS